ncbi:MAG: bi-domain-containing oxidoreductase [bacterium]
MKQILQNLGSGETILADIPCPSVSSGYLLVQTYATVVSLGTERMLIDFGKANLLDKARQQPEKVKQVIEKIKTDGLFATLETVRAKMDQPIPLGYCNAGVVMEVGPGVADIQVGDRVVSNGPHAEMVAVPRNLCAKIPPDVTDETAAFTVLGSIALEGIRLAAPTLGETVVVTGLGLIGLLCVQLLRANGCRVIGIDFDSTKCELARTFGAETVDLSRGEDPLSAALQYSRGRGVDAVIITASTKSNDPVHQAAQMCRKRGRIVLVGVTGLELSRNDFYEKELSFQVSCSYGPGRYDDNYEKRGLDYPSGFVRWTEGRNFEAVLDMMATGSVSVDTLISHRYPFEKALDAYEQISTGGALGIVLRYPVQNSVQTAKTVKLKEAISSSPQQPVVGFIGAGNFTGAVLLPAISKTGARLKTIASGAGVSGTILGKKFGFEQSTTDTPSLLTDKDINTIFVTTRHNSHAKLVIKALQAGKKVFVEKPLCLTREELADVQAAYSEAANPFLMVGFNRRFSPLSVKMKSLLDSVKEPKCLVMTVNAGAIPAEHWTQDKEVGGGRILGEGCHFVDLLRYLVGSQIVDVNAMQIKDPSGAQVTGDKMSFTLRFADGSIGTVHYFANGSKSFPKERLEVFCADRVLQLDNFRQLTGYGWPGFKSMKLSRQDKGHTAEIAAFIEAVEKGKQAPIPFEELVEVTEATLRIVENAV